MKTLKKETKHVGIENEKRFDRLIDFYIFMMVIQVCKFWVIQKLEF